MWYLLRLSLGSVPWGILIAVVCMVLFFVLIRGWYKGATFSPLSYIIGAILFLFLSVQCILIVGAVRISATTDFYEGQVSHIVEDLYDSSDTISLLKADDVVKEIIDEYPILQYYVDINSFSGIMALELPHTIAQSIKSFMRWYIFRRVLWCLAFVAIGAFLVIKTMDKLHNNSRSKAQVRYSPLHYDDF